MNKSKFSRGKFVNNVLVSETAPRLTTTPLVGLGIVDTSRISNVSRLGNDLSEYKVTVQHCIDVLEDEIGLPDYTSFDLSDDIVKYRLDLAVTEMNPGSQLLRWLEWLSLLGIGWGRVQLEGVLYDSNGHPILSFIDRRKDSELRNWRDILFGVNAPTMVKRMLVESAIAIFKEIQYRLVEKHT